MRTRELRHGAGRSDEEIDEMDRGEVRGRGRVVAATGRRAKQAFVRAAARAGFLPTLLYNVARNRLQPEEFRWWDRIDEYVLLGAVPFSRHVPHLKQLGVRGVITLTEPFETLVPKSLYEAHEIDQLEIPTVDYLFAPSQQAICQAVDFIHEHALQGGSTYVHCKAGRGRSTTVVLCYLIKYRNMTPQVALDHARSIRPRVKLAEAQWKAVTQFSFLTTTRCLQSSNQTCLNSGEESLADTETDDYTSSQSMISGSTTPSLCSDSEFVTGKDLEGYECSDPELISG